MIIYGCLSVLVFALWNALIYWHYIIPHTFFLCTHIICEFNFGIYKSFVVSSLLSYSTGLVFTIYSVSFCNYGNKRVSYLILSNLYIAHFIICTVSSLDIKAKSSLNIGNKYWSYLTFPCQVEGMLFLLAFKLNLVLKSLICSQGLTLTICRNIRKGIFK